LALFLATKVLVLAVLVSRKRLFTVFADILAHCSLFAGEKEKKILKQQDNKLRGRKKTDRKKKEESNVQERIAGKEGLKSGIKFGRRKEEKRN